MAKILLVGNDLRLLMTRSAVLARTAATIVYCDAIEAARILENEKFNLVVLCHSLTEEQTSKIREIIHRKLPTAMVLRLVFDSSLEIARGSTPFDVTSSTDPERLLHRAAELLRQTPTSIM